MSLHVDKVWCKQQCFSILIKFGVNFWFPYSIQTFSGALSSPLSRRFCWLKVDIYERGDNLCNLHNGFPVHLSTGMQGFFSINELQLIINYFGCFHINLQLEFSNFQSRKFGLLESAFKTCIAVFPCPAARFTNINKKLVINLQF